MGSDSASEIRRIETVLFDADGVLQRRPDGWRDSLADSFEFDGDSHEFLVELWNAEKPALDGSTDFYQSLVAVMKRWGSKVEMDHAVREWTRLEPVQEVLNVVRGLRRDGISCYLASNQERLRAAHMSKALRYSETFDGQFYSCDVGLVKPDRAFFEVVLERLGATAHHVLFIDDSRENVESAVAVGLHAEVFSLAEPIDRLLSLLADYDLRVGARSGDKR